MDKACTNHPESLAIGTCKSCDKPLCLMCMQDEKEGTFCSSKCYEVYKEVAQWVDSGSPNPAPPQIAAAAAKAKAAAQPKPPAGEEEDIVLTPGQAIPGGGGDPGHLPEDDSLLDMGRAVVTCYAHPAARAATSCRHCNRPICSACVISNDLGRFCSDICASAAKAQADAEAAAAQPKPPADEPMFTATGSQFKPATARRQVAPESTPEFDEPAPAAKSSSPALTVLAVVAVLVVAFVVGVLLLGPEKKDDGNPAVVTVPPKTDPPKSDPPKTEPPKTQPAVVTPPKVEPPKVDPPKVEPPKPVVTPPKVEPPKVEPPKVEPPKVEPPKPQPAVVVAPPKVEPAKPQKMVNPWATERAGNWYRLKVVQGVDEGYMDIGLKERGPGFYVLATQATVKGGAGPVQETRKEPEFVSLAGEETIKVDGKSYLCEIQELSEGGGVTKQWVLRQGRNAGAILKTESAGRTITPVKIWDHEVRVKSKTFDCTVVEAEEQAGGMKLSVKTWYCSALPLGMLKTETLTGSRSVVDMGGDWAKRPAFPAGAGAVAMAPPVVTPPKVEPPKVEPPKPAPPKVEPPKVEPPKVEPPKPAPPKPEPPKPVPPKVEPPKPEPPKPALPEDPALVKVKKELDDAARMERDADPLIKTVSANPLPKSEPELKTLQTQAGQAERLLNGARLIYMNNEEAAPDPAAVRKSIKSLNERLAALRERNKLIREGLAAKPGPPKVEPPKPEPPKPVPPKVEPPKPEPPKPEPPKPAPPKVEPPKPEPPKEDPAAAKAKKELEEAAGMLREATPLYQQVMDANPLPSDPGALKALWDKAAKAEGLLDGSRKLYAANEKAAPDPGTVRRRVSAIDGLLSSLKEKGDKIKAGLAAKPEPPKSEPPKVEPAAQVKKDLDEAGRLIRQATPLYQETMDAETLPTEAASLRALLESGRKAEALLVSAQKLYAANEQASPDPTATRRRIDKLEELIVLLNKRIEAIRQGLQ